MKLTEEEKRESRRAACAKYYKKLVSLSTTPDSPQKMKLLTSATFHMIETNAS